MSISFKGFNEKVLTFNTESELAEGTLVKMKGSNTVTACTDGDKIIGVVLSCRAGIASVQVSGYVNLPCSGALPIPGYCSLCAASATEIKEDVAVGRELMVVENDKTASTAGFML